MHSKELVEKAKGGDMNAFDKLYRLHVRLLYAYVSRFIFCKADIEDIVSDVFTKAIFKLKKFESRSSFATWLIRIADNAIKDFFRRVSRYSDEPAEDISIEQSPDEIIGSRLIKSIIHESLEILTPKQRNVLVLHGLQGYTFKEVAGNLSLTERAVKSRYYLAIERLRKHLIQDPFVQEYFQGRYKHDEKTKFQRTNLNRNSCQLFAGAG